jgi:hypothetical protein
MCFKNVYTNKKKLKGKPLSEEERELINNYDYLLSLFVNFFNYSVDQFDLLTVVQADLILQQRDLIESDFHAFIQNEFRLSNFYTIKTAMADTKKIKNPQDLYKLNFEETPKAKEFKPFKLDEYDLKMLNKMIGKN